MSFATDFSSIAGTVGDTFKNVWNAVNAPTHITLPATQTGVVSSGVGASIQRNSAAATSGVSATTILLGAAVAFLGIAAIMLGRK